MSDGGNTVIGAIDMNSHIIKNVADPLSNQAITTAGDVMSCDIQLNVGSDLARCLGCNDLTTGKTFTLLLG